jgi:arsenate reductase
MVLKLLREEFRLDVSDARSKSWEEFQDVEFDFVITLCDSAKETCPVYPGKPILAHWSSPDPAAFAGDEKATSHLFFEVAQQIKRRLELLTSLPFEKLDELRLELATKEIGEKEKITLPQQSESFQQ